MNISAVNSATVGSVAEPTTLRRPGAGPADSDVAAAERKKASQQFEAILVRQLLGKTVGSMLGSKDSTAGSVYGDMLTDSLATQLSSGRGLGLGTMLERQLAPRVPAAGKLTQP